MATKMLSEKLGEVEYDNLIVGLTPPKRVGAGKIASVGSKEATGTTTTTSREKHLSSTTATPATIRKPSTAM